MKLIPLRLQRDFYSGDGVVDNSVETVEICKLYYGNQKNCTSGAGGAGGRKKLKYY